MEVIKLNMMVCDKARDDFMHAADLFEPFKRLNQNLYMEYELEHSEPNLDFLIRLKAVYEKNGYKVTALWIANKPEVHYVDWSIKAISDGSKWGLLDDYLKQFKIVRPEDKNNLTQNEKADII